MKKSIFYVGASVVGGAMFVLSSCGSLMPVSKTETAKVRNVVGVGVVHVPTIADLDVSPKKVTETFEVKVPKDKTNPNAASDAAKSIATAQLLTKLDADVLIEPRYYVENSSAWGATTVKVTVSGYPATYKNFRPMVAKDTSLLQVRPTHIPYGIVEGTLTTGGK